MEHLECPNSGAPYVPGEGHTCQKRLEHHAHPRLPYAICICGDVIILLILLYYIIDII